jgi:hypothetical protein
MLSVPSAVNVVSVSAVCLCREQLEEQGGNHGVPTVLPLRHIFLSFSPQNNNSSRRNNRRKEAPTKISRS